MKKLSLLLILLTIAFSANAFAQQPKTVTDYFLAFPADKYATDIEGKKIKGKAALTKFRKSLIKIEDVKNGYLKLEGTWKGWAEIAIFKKKDGSYIIGQTESGCSPACEGNIKFYTYKAGKWTDITEQVFPTLTEAFIKNVFIRRKINMEDNGLSSYFLLPREGTTVKMAFNMCKEDGDEHFTLLEFGWTGAKFEIK